MPLFRFSVQDGRKAVPVTTLRLADVSAAKAEALQLAGQMLRDDDRKATFDEAWHVDVSDAVGMVLFRICVTLSTSTAARLQEPLAPSR